MWPLVIAVAATTTLVAGVRWQTATAPISAAVSYDEGTFGPAPELAKALGAGLAPDEVELIKQLAANEVEHAFRGLRIHLTGERRAFWRVRVVPSVVWRSFNGRARINAAGASWGFGPLGGAAFVNFNTLALHAVRYAPSNASRRDIVEAIGRGVGRSAVHEFAHMITGGAQIDNATDERSYEYRTADRASQYYGTLHWANAWPVLQQRVGK
jgi:hypothetical protein